MALMKSYQAKYQQAWRQPKNNQWQRNNGEGGNKRIRNDY
jgi:hypothetical protein